MKTTRTTISIPNDLLSEFKKIIGDDKNFSEQIRVAMTEYIASYKRSQYLQAMEKSYKKNLNIWNKSSKEHEAFREDTTNSITKYEN